MIRTNFGNMIKAARVSVHLSQAELGLRFGVQQATISAWENGKQFPSADDEERLSPIAHFLGVSLATLKDQLKKEPSQINPIRPYTETTFYQAEAAWLHGLGGKTAEIWIVCPDIANLLSSPLAQAAWAHCLQAGVSYHLIWSTYAYQTRAMYATCAQLAALLQCHTENNPLQGKLVHYLTNINNLTDRITLSGFREFEHWSTCAHPANTFQLLNDIQTAEAEKIARYIHPNGPATILYLPQYPSDFCPFSGLILDGVRMENSASSQCLFLFQDFEHTRDLALNVSAFKESCT